MAIELITAQDVRGRGESTRGLERGMRAGRLVRLRTGVYAVAEHWERATARERHRASMAALAATATRPPVFSHESAALLHGIPVIGAWPVEPHVVDPEPHPATRRTRRGVVCHRVRHPLEPCVIEGMVATGLIDTALGLAASRSLAAGVAALDHVLARGVSKADVERVIAWRRPFHGAKTATTALEIATGLAETPLESISLVPIHLAGLPRPQQQVEVRARGRTFRLDYLWPDLGIAGEADGRLKYLAPDDLWREKLRQDALASLGLSVARWGWSDALAGDPLLARLHEAGMPFAPRRATYSSRTHPLAVAD